MPVVVPAPFGTPPLRKGGEVFIVGAGFSKAIAQDAMPTLDELGHRVSAPFRKTPSFNLLPAAAQDALLRDRLPGGSLEAWLSHLAVPQPFLTEPERLHNQAIAQELTELLVNEIEDSQMAAMATAAPPWLTRLVALWDRLAATVVTFNYDTLVEHAVTAARMPWNFGQLPTELWNARLLKMHGSLSWWWIPTDRVGNTIYRDDLYGSWGDPAQAPLVGGMVRLVVPPLAAKSDYYDLSAMRELWQQAREALMSASRIVLLGYSAPSTDLAVVALLSQYVLPTVPISVVDIAPGSVIKRLRDVGLAADTPPSVASVPEFVQAYEREVSRTVAADLLAGLTQPFTDLNRPVIARICGDGPAPQRSVMEVGTVGDLTAIVARDWQPGESIVNDSIRGIRLQQELQGAASAGRRLVLRINGQPDRAVLNVGGILLQRSMGGCRGLIAVPIFR